MLLKYFRSLSWDEIFRYARNDNFLNGKIFYRATERALLL